MSHPFEVLSPVWCLEREGFEITVQTEQKFNVVCVTKYRAGDGGGNYHLPITGEAVVRQVVFARSDVTFTKTIVTFRGRDYDLSEVRNGLSGTAVVIGIQVEDTPYVAWHLYTDTPSAHPDRSGEEVTSAAIRKEAKRMMRNRGHEVW